MNYRSLKFHHLKRKLAKYYSPNLAVRDSKMKPAVCKSTNDGKNSINILKLPDLACRVKYSNTLPDLPFDAKFIMYPFQQMRFVHYKPTSLERNYKYEHLTELDVGVQIDLVNKDVYANYCVNKLEPIDEQLLEEDGMTYQDNKRSQHHARSVSWLRRTEYISTEQTRFQPQNAEKVEARVGYMTKKCLMFDNLDMGRQSQIAAIQKTFQDSNKIIQKHYGKPNVTAIEVLPIFPDFNMWKHSCAEVIFDSDPTSFGTSTSSSRKIETMSQALIRGVMDETGQQFVAYFLPHQEVNAKASEKVVGQHQYTLVREYNWNVKNKTCKSYEETYVFIVREDGVYYNELETRVNLHKRRRKVNNNTKLLVTYRPFTSQELKAQTYKERQLKKNFEGKYDDEQCFATESEMSSQHIEL